MDIFISQIYPAFDETRVVYHVLQMRIITSLLTHESYAIIPQRSNERTIQICHSARFVDFPVTKDNFSST